MKLIFLALLLSGCSRITSGRIVEKNYYKPYTHTEFQPLTIGDVTVYIPHNEEIPARYEIVVENEGGKGRINVPRSTWDSVKTGELYGVEDQP